LQGHMGRASYVPGELIPLPLSGSIPELPHVAKHFGSRLRGFVLGSGSSLVASAVVASTDAINA
jgi:hypothetical protein